MRAARISYKGHLIGEIHSDGQTAYCNCYNKTIEYRKVPQSMWVTPVLDGRFDNIDKSGVHEDGFVEVSSQDDIGLVIEVTVDAEDVSSIYLIWYRDECVMVRYSNMGDVSRLRVRVKDVSQEVYVDGYGVPMCQHT